MTSPRITRSGSRRRFLAAGATATAGALAGCLDGLLGGSSGGSGSVATAPVPDDTGAFDYAVAGTGDDPTVTYYGNWKCPFCAQFSTGFMGDLLTDYVEPGSITLQFRAMAYTGDGQPFLGEDAVTATRAGLAVWESEPESYWSFHEHVFANQPPESQQWANAGRLVEFARDAGVEDTTVIRDAINEERYQSRIEATTEDAFAAGVTGTPTLIVGGTPVSPFEEQQTRDRIESVIA